MPHRVLVSGLDALCPANPQHIDGEEESERDDDDQANCSGERHQEGRSGGHRIATPLERIEEEDPEQKEQTLSVDEVQVERGGKRDQKEHGVSSGERTELPA